MLRLLLVTSLLCVPAFSQKPDRLPRWKQDPYTKNEPELMQKLGYVSYGPFEFGPVSSEEVDKFLSFERIRWVETAHFRIGTSLPAWTLPQDPEVKLKIREELTRLAEKLPPGRVNPKTRVLDEWLRVHLLAQRMEELYAEIQSWLGVDDKMFPPDREHIRMPDGRYMGMGPFLGQENKYLLFIPETESTYLSFLKKYIGRTAAFGQRWNFKEQGSLFYGIGSEMEDGRLKDDTGLHNNLIFNVTHNLIDGFRFYAYDLPVWIKEGLGHWFERKNSPKWNTFDQNEGGMADKKTLWKWEPYTRQLISGDKVTPLGEVMKWRDYNEIAFNDHVLIWSRWDFLLSLGKEKFAKFMFHVKGRIDPETWMADQSDLVGATRDALLEAYGFSPLTLDEQWKEWVLKNYSSQ